MSGSEEKIKLAMPVIVEGKYDKIKLSNFIDGIIITTGGFAIYRNKQKMALIRKYAHETGVIILTDSDGAGFQIRNMLKSRLGGSAKIINAYIPDVFGKERRKDKPSKEGKLGVEGIDRETLLKAFAEAGVTPGSEIRAPWADRQRLVDDGLSGGENSSELRRELCRHLKLPERISSKGLLEALNTLYSEEEYIKALDYIRQTKT
jgi:ribonuclease M5